jgi:hypothetical protein
MTERIYTKPNIKELMSEALRLLLPQAEEVEITPASIQYLRTGEEDERQ